MNLIILLVWTNAPTPFASNYVTVVEQTGNFKRWRPVAEFPYATNGFYRATNTAQMGFFRISNKIREP